MEAVRAAVATRAAVTIRVVEMATAAVAVEVELDVEAERVAVGKLAAARAKDEKALGVKTMEAVMAVAPPQRPLQVVRQQRLMNDLRTSRILSHRIACSRSAHQGCTRAHQGRTASQRRLCLLLDGTYPRRGTMLHTRSSSSHCLHCRPRRHPPPRWMTQCWPPQAHRPKLRSQLSSVREPSHPCNSTRRRQHQLAGRMA